MKKTNITRSKNKRIRFYQTDLYESLNWILIISVPILTLWVVLTMIYDPNNYAVKSLNEGGFQLYIDKYHEHYDIVRVSLLCENASDPLICVWENIPYNYNKTRYKFNFETVFKQPLVIPPKQYFGSNGSGICRDNAVMTRAILDNLNITNEFTFKPFHVYITAKNQSGDEYVFDGYLYINGRRYNPNAEKQLYFTFD